MSHSPKGPTYREPGLQDVMPLVRLPQMAGIVTIIDFCHSPAQVPHPCSLEFRTISGTIHKCLKTPKRMVGPGDSMLLSSQHKGRGLHAYTCVCVHVCISHGWT